MFIKNYKYTSDVDVNGVVIWTRHKLNNAKKWVRFGTSKPVYDKDFNHENLPALWEADDIRESGW